MYGNNQEIEYSKLSDPLTSFNDDSKVGAKVMLESRWIYLTKTSQTWTQHTNCNLLCISVNWKFLRGLEFENQNSQSFKPMALCIPWCIRQMMTNVYEKDKTIIVFWKSMNLVYAVQCKLLTTKFGFKKEALSRLQKFLTIFNCLFPSQLSHIKQIGIYLANCIVQSNLP